MSDAFKSIEQLIEDMDRNDLLTPAALRAKESSWRQGYWKGYTAALDAFLHCFEQRGLATAVYDHLYEFQRTAIRDWVVAESEALAIEPPPRPGPIVEVAD